MAFYLKNFSRMKELMPQQDIEKLIHAFIFNQVDYCNRVLTSLTKKSIIQLAVPECCCSLNPGKQSTSHQFISYTDQLSVAQRRDFKILLFINHWMSCHQNILKFLCHLISLPDHSGFWFTLQLQNQNKTWRSYVQFFMIICLEVSLINISWSSIIIFLFFFFQPVIAFLYFATAM